MSRADQAQAVARSYRAALQDIAAGRSTNPGADLHILDERWKKEGITWLTPAPIPAEPDEWMSAADIAQYVGRTPKDIWNWAHRSETTGVQQRPGPDGAPEYNVQSVVDYWRRRTIRNMNP